MEINQHNTRGLIKQTIVIPDNFINGVLTLLGVIITFFALSNLFKTTTLDISISPNTVVNEFVDPVENQYTASDLQIPIPTPIAKPKQTFHSETFLVKRNQSITSILKHSKLAPKQITQLLDLPQAFRILSHLTAGHKLTVKSSIGGKLLFLNYQISDNSSLYVKRHHQELHSYIQEHGMREKINLAESSVIGSLYQSAKSAHINANIVKQLTQIFKAKIDFARNLRKGDSFSVLYREYYKNHKAIRSGKIIAAEFDLHGKIIQAIGYPSHQKFYYYTPNGICLQKAFIRTPVHYSRISSPFNLHRMHPILHILRPHTGVDLAAPMGTPIVAASSGKIIFIGHKGGYGKAIEVKYNSKYTTLYGHMSRFAKAMKVGRYVNKGQVIGYVGMTGLASGPHLHYELRVNNKPVNPLTAKLPPASYIAKRNQNEFKLYAEKVIHRMDESNSEG